MKNGTKDIRQSLKTRFSLITYLKTIDCIVVWQMEVVLGGVGVSEKKCKVVMLGFFRRTGLKGFPSYCAELIGDAEENKLQVLLKDMGSHVILIAKLSMFQSQNLLSP